MWVKVDDGLPEHAKVLEAGRHLGPRGAGRVLAIWLVGLAYCNRNLTDGFVREDVVRTWVVYDKAPFTVAEAMSLAMPDGSAGLLERVDNGFRFHDYHHYQPVAASVKAKRERDRARKAASKVAKDSARNPDGIHTSSAEDSAWNPERSRARDPDPGPDHRKDHRAPRGPSEPVDARRVLKALVWREVEAARTDPEQPWDLFSVTERLKCVAARAGLVYAVDEFHDQIELAMHRLDARREVSA